MRKFLGLISTFVEVTEEKLAVGIFARPTSWIGLKISHMLYTESKKKQKKHVVINGKKLEMLFLQTQKKCLGLTKDKTIQIFYYTFSFALFFTVAFWLLHFDLTTTNITPLIYLFYLNTIDDDHNDNDPVSLSMDWFLLIFKLRLKYKYIYETLISDMINFLEWKSGSTDWQLLMLNNSFFAFMFFFFRNVPQISLVYPNAITNLFSTIIESKSTIF